MTRINVGIKPKQLTDQHLIAELRELPRIFTAVNKRIKAEKDFNDITPNFKLGIGHVKFFYDKLEYLLLRHQSLRIEYFWRYKKNYKFKIEKLNNIPFKYFRNYIPTDFDRKVLIDRISERINNSNQIPKYYGKQISKENAIKNLFL